MCSLGRSTYRKKSTRKRAPPASERFSGILTSIRAALRARGSTTEQKLPKHHRPTTTSVPTTTNDESVTRDGPGALTRYRGQGRTVQCKQHTDSSESQARTDCATTRR